MSKLGTDDVAFQIERAVRALRNLPDKDRRYQAGLRALWPDVPPPATGTEEWWLAYGQHKETYNRVGLSPADIDHMDHVILDWLPRQAGYDNVTNRDIRTAIDAAIRARSVRTGVTVERVVNALSFVAFEGEQRMGDKLKALELLRRHLGMFTDKLQVNGGGVPGIVSGLSADEMARALRGELTAEELERIEISGVGSKHVVIGHKPMTNDESYAKYGRKDSADVKPT